MRLTDYGYKYGLISEERYKSFTEKRQKISDLTENLNKIHLGKTSKVNEYLIELGYEPLDNGVTASELLKRSGVKYNRLKKYLDLPEDLRLSLSGEEELEISIKYEGYIKDQKKETLKLRKFEEVKLKDDIDYMHMEGLALEARQKLSAIQPKTVGQASRISGVNPADITTLILYLKRDKKI